MINPCIPTCFHIVYARVFRTLSHVLQANRIYNRFWDKQDFAIIKVLKVFLEKHKALKHGGIIHEQNLFVYDDTVG